MIKISKEDLAIALEYYQDSTKQTANFEVEFPNIYYENYNITEELLQVINEVVFPFIIQKYGITYIHQPPTPFIHRPKEIEEDLCRRYYEDKQ